MPAAPGHRLDLDVGGRHTPVWVHPRGRTGRRPLLLIHGFRGDHHGMDRIAAAVRSRDVIVPDLPGFGRAAPLPEGLTLDGYCRFIEDLLSAVGSAWGSRPVLVGHSFGSVLVAHALARRPGLVTELGLINPITTPALAGPSRALTGLTRAYYELGARLPERLGHGLLAHPAIVRLMSEVMATTRDPGLRAYIHSQHARHFSTFSDRDSLAQAFSVSVAHTVTEVAWALTVPMLVIAGDRDAIAPIGPTRDVVAGLPEAELLELAGVGHLVHYELPEDAAAALEAFASAHD